MFEIHTVVFHHKPHLDEKTAFFLASVYGNHIFLGINEAKIEFWGKGIENVQETGQELLKHGYLCLGVRGGLFDEHKTGGRQKNVCAATLMAEYLNIADYPEVLLLLRYVNKSDNKGDRYFGLASMDKCLERYSDADPVELLNWTYDVLTDYFDCKLNIVPEGPRVDIFKLVARYLREEFGADIGPECGQSQDPYELIEHIGLKRRPELTELRHYLNLIKNKEMLSIDFDLRRVADWIGRGQPDRAYEDTAFFLDAHFRRQHQFHYVCPRQINNKGVWHDMPYRGRQLKVLEIESDNFEIASCARHLYGADAVIQKNASGNCSITFNRKSGIGGKTVATIGALVRLEEQLARHNGLKVVNREQLRSNGMPEKMPCWYMEAENGWILNGSLSHPLVPATRLALKVITETVKLGFREGSNPCGGEICTRESCPLYRYGLPECRKLKEGNNSARIV